MPLKNDKELLEDFNKRRNISEGQLQDQHSIAEEDHAFFAGDEAYYSASVLDKGSKKTVVFNKVKPYVDAVAGFMIQLRRKPEYLAMNPDNQRQKTLSDYMNGLSDYARDNANMDSIETMQDKEMLITGYGAIDTSVNYEQNPDGEVKAELVDFDDVFWDPESRETNLLDSRWVFRRKKFNIKEALKRFKGSKPEDFDRVQEHTTGYQYNPDGGIYDKIAYGGGIQEEDLVQVYYYQWWDIETYYRGENPAIQLAQTNPQLARLFIEQLTGIMEIREAVAPNEESDDYFDFDPRKEYLVMTPRIKNDVVELASRFGVDMEVQEHLKKVYYTTVNSRTKIFRKFKSPDQQGFTIKFKTGDFDRVNKVWFGLVAGLKNPNMYANKSLTEILYIIAANSKGGVMYEESAVDDKAKFEQDYARTNGAVKVNDGALQSGAIQPKARPSMSNGYEGIYGIANQSMNDVTGINKEFLGSSENKQVSALLEGQRINQVVTTLATYFDSISLYTVEQARLMITYLRILAQNSTGRLVKIIGPDGAFQVVELLEDALLEEYDVTVGEAPVSATQRTELAQTMITIARELLPTGKNLYPIVIDYIPGLKQKDKIRLLEALQPPQSTPEQRNAAATQAALQQEMMAATLDAQRARSAKDLADAQLKETQSLETLVDMDKTRAETIKTLEEAQQKDVENTLLQTRGLLTGVSAVI